MQQPSLLYRRGENLYGREENLPYPLNPYERHRHLRETRFHEKEMYTEA